MVCVKRVGAVALLLLVLAVYLVGSVTRTISNTQDSKDTLIRNSDGNYWEPLPENIQAAIDDLGSGTVWLPEGTFIITQTIQLGNKMNLIGMGSSTILELGDGQNKDILVINGGDNIVIRDIFFDGNEANQGAYSAYSGIDIKGSASNPSTHVTIRDCYFKDIVASHIDAEEHTSCVTVDSCHFEGRRMWSGPTSGYGGAIWFSGQDNVAKNNFIKDTYACGVVFEAGTGSPPAQGIVEGNIITGEICHGVHMEGNGKSENCIIMNNYFHDLGSEAYDVANGRCFAINLQPGSIASGNIVDGIRPDAKESYGILASDGNVTMEGNIVKNCGYGLVRYHGDAPSHLLGNKVENMTKTGIYCGGFSDNTVIIGNTVRNTGEHGIYLLNGRQNCIVSGNIVSNIGSYGILEADTSDYNVVTGNIARGETIVTHGANTIKANNIAG